MSSVRDSWYVLYERECTVVLHIHRIPRHVPKNHPVCFLTNIKLPVELQENRADGVCLVTCSVF